MISQQEKILIVDDEQLIRKLLRQKLSFEGYQCDEAGSAEHALERLHLNPCDLVILDIRMPGKWGTELLPEIKATYPVIAVIMATAIAETSVAIQCMRQGADDYICKPFNLEQVSTSVLRTLEKQRLQLKIKEYQQSLENRVDEQTNEIRKLFLGGIEALVYALEAKDKYTGGHSRRVTEIALAIGNEVGLPKNEIENLRWASLLHDVGKIAVDQLIQNKRGKLTQEEYEHIMIHAHVGAGIVKPVVNDQVVEMIEHHHDRFNGSGLHQVVAGNAIPLGARILAIADAFDAMTSDRPYRLGMPVQKALNEVKHCAGTQFDPSVADIFLKMKDMDKLLAKIGVHVEGDLSIIEKENEYNEPDKESSHS